MFAVQVENHMNELLSILEQMSAELVTIEDTALFIVSHDIPMLEVDKLFNAGSVTFMEHRKLKAAVGTMQGFKKFRILGEDYGYVDSF